MISKKKLVYCGLMFFISSFTIMGAELNLSIAEQEFLKENLIIRIGNQLDWPPYDFADQGVAKGLFVDYMELIADYMGIEIEWVNGYIWPGLLKLMETRELDVLPVLINVPSREQYLLHTIPYFETHIGWIARKHSGIEHDKLDLTGKKIASAAGRKLYEYILNDYPSAVSIIVPTSDDGIKSVLDGTVSYYMDDLGSLLYKQQIMQIQNESVVGSFILMNKEDLYLRMGVRKGLPLLKSILDKAIASIPPSRVHEIQEKWLGRNPMVDDLFIEYGALTEEEMIWLKNHPVIRASILPGTPPISYIDKEGDYKGIASDYVTELEKHLGIEIQIQNDIDWTTSLDNIADGKIDLITAIVETSERSESMRFTQSYIDDPIAIYGLNNSANISNMNELYNLRIVVNEGYAIIDWLEQDLPGFELIQVSNYQEAFQMLKKKKADVFVSDLFGANHFLEKGNYNDISIVGITPYSYEVAMAVRKDWIILWNIISKALTKIETEQKNIIESKWFLSEIEGVIYKEQIKYYFSIFLFIIAVVLIWGYKQRQLRIRTHELVTIDPLTGLNNRREFDEIFTEERKRAGRFNLSLMFLILDVDNFKLYNDTYGHKYGDEILKKIGTLLHKTYKRAGDRIFRLGGEEFGCLILLEKETDAFNIGERFRLNLVKEAWEHKKNHPFNIVTVSGGISVVTSQDSRSIEEIYHDADTTMYKAKQSGRNQVIFEA